jgi:alkanesulfonate monooxygenase SsuD/methylene tetrahydromethanopterin reductase-like flavin-dependent oxidoreductase (luciferase family)
MGLPFEQPDGRAPTTADVMARARLIERLGFDGIWFGDSIGRVKTPRPDNLLWLAIAAAATEHIEIGTAVLQVPLRNPVELAKRLFTIHGLAGGRFTAGLGAGSTRGDFEAVGVDYTQRFKLFRAALPIIQGLCRGEDVNGINLAPWPNTRGGLRILIGAWESGIWVTRAAQQYDGWMASGLTTFRALSEGIRRFHDAGGTRAMVATVEVNLKKPHTRFDADERFSLACDRDEAADRLHRLADLGFTDVGLVQYDHTEADLTEEDLVEVRGLFDREPPRRPE